MQAYPGAVPQAAASASHYVTKVQLNICCKKLADKDLMSKSDPMAVVLVLKNNNWIEVGRTERLANSLNPQFSTPIIIDYFFEELQKLKFVIHDIDSASGSLKDADFLGEMQCNLGQLVASRKYMQQLKAQSGAICPGTITVAAEEVSGSNDVACLNFRASKLDNKDFLGKSDPYLEFSRSLEDGSFMVVHRTEVVQNNLNPCWKTIQVSVQQLCNGDYDRVIKVSCSDWDSDGSHDLIGSFTTTLKEMMSAQTRELQWPCINEKKQKKKKNYKNSGMVFLSKCQVTRVHSFLDYIQGGCQLNFTVGIDFTGSNGDPRQSTSLHYMNPYAPNEYTQALTAVGEIIQDYDSDKMFPAFGFGARLPPTYQAVSHQFALNFNPSNPYCAGLPGLMQAYQTCVQQVQLYGPTNVSPIIKHVSQFASQAAQHSVANNYFILLILTDGVITDMDETKLAVVEASALPMSIIIVGVGGADFQMMEELDCDEGRLRAGGKTAQRDIVQFVPYRKFQTSTGAELAKEVLAEVPKQLTDYYKAKNIVPGTIAR